MIPAPPMILLSIVAIYQCGTTLSANNTFFQPDIDFS